MHIVLLNDDALPDAKGGAAVVVDHLRKAYTKLGHTVTLITSHQHEHGEVVVETDAFGKSIVLPIQYNKKKRHRFCVSRPPHLAVLDAIFDDLKPDAVHAHNLHAYLGYNSLSIASKHTSKIFLTAHDTFLVSFGRVRGLRFQQDDLGGIHHELDLRDHLSNAGREYWPFRNGCIKHILKKSGTKVISISEALRGFLEVNGISVHSMIHNGTEVFEPISEKEKIAFRHEYGIKGPVILYGGRLSEDKGSSALLHALDYVREKCPIAKCIIAGEKERIKHFLERATDEEREMIILTGWIAPEHMRAAYSATTVVTTPSIYLDPFNLMNIEAMAEGIPVVGTCFGGTPEIIIDGKTGYIRNPKSTQRYADALSDLLCNPKKAKKMGEAGRQHVLENFTLEKQAKAYIAEFSA